MLTFDYQFTYKFSCTIARHYTETDRKKIEGSFDAYYQLTDDEIKFQNVETPEFPNGINSLREKVVDLFYSDGIIVEGRELKTIVKFVVEKDGSLSEISADGEIPAFNKQAEIALYLLPDKFKPGTINGNTVRYMFKLPIRMRW